MVNPYCKTVTFFVKKLVRKRPFTFKETSTEVTELEAKVRGKQQMIETLQEEILSMTVKKELLSSAVEKVNHRHQEQVEQIACQQREIEAKISEYAVLAPTSTV